MKKLFINVFLIIALILILSACDGDIENPITESDSTNITSLDHAEFWQLLNRPDLSSMGTTLHSQYESFIGYVEDITFDGIIENNDGYLLLKRSEHDSGESEIISLRFRLTSSPPDKAGGGTKSGMPLKEIKVGELVVVYFTHLGEAVWVAYPIDTDYDAPNLLK